MTYERKCNECTCTWEEERGINDPVKWNDCPLCGSTDLINLISSSAVHFKGVWETQQK